MEEQLALKAAGHKNIETHMIYRNIDKRLAKVIAESLDALHAEREKTGSPDVTDGNDAVLLAILFGDSIKAVLWRLMPETSVKAWALQAQDPIRQELEPAPGMDPARSDQQQPASGGAAPAPELQRSDKPRYERCLDGSALTVTGRDLNQTNFRCGSGAIGAYTN